MRSAPYARRSTPTPQLRRNVVRGLRAAQAAEETRKDLFPAKLYEIASRRGDITCRWVRDQRPRHRGQQTPRAEFMPAFFNGTGNYTSFARQLNYYGFNRLDAKAGTSH